MAKKAKKKVRRAGKPEYSAGARYERKAFRSVLRRRLKSTQEFFDVADESGESGSDPNPVYAAYKELLDWVLKREKRYDSDKGGL